MTLASTFRARVLACRHPRLSLARIPLKPIVNRPVSSLPPTRPTSEKLHPDRVHEELCEAIEKSDLLRPLLPVLKNEIPDGDDEAHFAFAKMFEIIRRLPSFQQKYDEDVPDVIKPFIEKYAFPTDQADQPKKALKSHLTMAPAAVVKSRSVLSELNKLVPKFAPELDKLPETQPLGPTVPLPPSPEFRRFALAIAESLAPFPEVMEGDGKPMERVRWGTKFKNWGRTIQNSPSDTFVARTEVGLCNLVKWAKSEGKKVRVAGYRHTWSDFFSADDQILVMLLPVRALTQLPSFSPSMQEIQKHSDLVGIEVPPIPLGANSSSTLCTIKAGTTNDMFRKWCLENRQWTLPFNVIMVEITMGGSNGPICHGAGLSTTTLSDLVAEFHYIDPDGNKKSISDPEQLRADSGCFGLLGICTAITLRLDAMSAAVMNPVKLPLPLAIPPPVGYKVPSAVDMSGITPEQLEQARQDFIKRCEEDYYLEWFWFPLKKKVWVNTWKKVDVSTSDLLPYPSSVEAIIQWFEGWLAQEIVSTWEFRHLPGRWQALALSTTALSQMPNRPDPQRAIKTLLSEALHFRRGIQNMRCLDSEWEIPLPEDPNAPGKRDYELIQRAWWDAITVFYSREDVPMRLALEMRLTGGSNVILAPQSGNDLGTISIEVLTVPTAHPDKWQSYMQQIADAWTNYADSKGNLLNSRPHWAKQWQGLTVRGQPIETYLKETAYKNAIPEFRATLEKIAAAQGTTVKAMRERFGNPLLERLFFDA